MTNVSRFDHLVAMTDRIGTFEHAEHTVPRREHGYCVDDVARVLVVTAREPRPNEAVRSLAQGSLAFISDSMGTRGDIRNRRDADGTWSSDWCTEDCWGRSLWASERRPRVRSSRSPVPRTRCSSAARCCGRSTRAPWRSPSWAPRPLPRSTHQCRRARTPARRRRRTARRERRSRMALAR